MPDPLVFHYRFTPISKLCLYHTRKSSGSQDVISGYDHVIEADAVIKDDVISLAIITSYAISEEYAKQLGDNFVRAMGAGAAIYNKELNGPAADSYGGVYKHYTVHIGIYNVAEEDVAVGTMAKGASRIRWQ